VKIANWQKPMIGSIHQKSLTSSSRRNTIIVASIAATKKTAEKARRRSAGRFAGASIMPMKPPT